MYVHYGQANSSDLSDSANVWGNYVVVNHLSSTPDSDNTTLEMQGSIDQNFNTVFMTSANQVSGKINGALEFNGVSQYVCLDNDGNGNYACSAPSNEFDSRRKSTYRINLVQRK